MDSAVGRNRNFTLITLTNYYLSSVENYLDFAMTVTMVMTSYTTILVDFVAIIMMVVVGVSVVTEEKETDDVDAKSSSSNY